MVSLTLIATAIVLSLSFSPEWTALNGNGTKLIKVSFSAALQRWMESPKVKLYYRLWDFFSFHYLHLPKAVQSPNRLLIQYIFLLSFTFYKKKFTESCSAADTHNPGLRAADGRPSGKLSR